MFALHPVLLIPSLQSLEKAAILNIIREDASCGKEVFLHKGGKFNANRQKETQTYLFQYRIADLHPVCFYYGMWFCRRLCTGVHAHGEADPMYSRAACGMAYI